MRTDPARNAEQSFPPDNRHFSRQWEHDVVTGPDAPDAPAHAASWHAPVADRRVHALARHNAVRRAAETAWGRLVGGDREAGLQGRGDRG